MIVWIAIFFLSFSFSMAILTMVTGEDPVYDINQFRALILHSRTFSIYILIICLYLQLERLLCGGGKVHLMRNFIDWLRGKK